MKSNGLAPDSRREVLVTKALQASEAQYLELCENVTDIVFTLNSTGDFTFMNRAGQKAGGFSREEVLEMNFADIVAAEYAMDARAIIAWQPQYAPAFQEMELIAKDGRRLPIRLRLSTIFDQGRPAGLQAIGRLLTEPSEFESDSRQSEKMRAMGRLGAGIAHDFNNVLTAILGYGDLVLGELEAGSPTHREVGEMVRAAQRAATLTSQLLGFSRSSSQEARVLDLNTAVAGVERMLRRVITENIEIVVRLEQGLDPVRADQSAIELAILNLALNARDAMPEGGTLILETSTVTLETMSAAAELGLSVGRYARLRVSDTGCGMNKDLLSQAFDPFFTTKDLGKGTGLGLPSAVAAVKQSKGQIAVTSTPQKGTTFEIYLPTIARTARGLGVGHAGRRLEAGCETVLVLDDEEMIRGVVHAFLGKSGYWVLEAANGVEATQISEQHSGPIDLLLTDVVMPQMSGPQSAERLLATRPEMKVLYMSGHSRDTIVGHGLLESDAALLKKPFTPDSLERKVRELLAS